MTDRFKFRFYHYETGKEYEVKAICFEGRPIITVQYNPILKFPLDSGELIQCTGLKDKNGKLIYEGDIIGGLFGGYVKWCDSCKSFEMFFDDECGACNGDIYWYEIVEDDGKLEVIGNIHENEELLK